MYSQFPPWKSFLLLHQWDPGKILANPQRISTSPLKHKTDSQQQFKCTRLGPVIWVFSPHHIPSFQARDISVAQVGNPVKSWLKPPCQTLSGVSFPIPNKLTSYVKFWTVATTMETLKKELGLHQEDRNPGPFQLFRLTPAFHPLSRELLFF